MSTVSNENCNVTWTRPTSKLKRFNANFKISATRLGKYPSAVRKALFYNLSPKFCPVFCTWDFQTLVECKVYRKEIILTSGMIG